MTNAQSMPCHYCGEGSLVQETYDDTLKSRGTSFKVTGLVRWRCDACESTMVRGSEVELNAARMDLAMITAGINF